MVHAGGVADRNHTLQAGRGVVPDTLSKVDRNKLTSTAQHKQGNTGMKITPIALAIKILRASAPLPSWVQKMTKEEAHTILRDASGVDFGLDGEAWLAWFMKPKSNEEDSEPIEES